MSIPFYRLTYGPADNSAPPRTLETMRYYKILDRVAQLVAQTTESSGPPVQGAVYLVDSEGYARAVLDFDMSLDPAGSLRPAVASLGHRVAAPAGLDPLRRL